MRKKRKRKVKPYFAVSSCGMPYDVDIWKPKKSFLLAPTDLVVNIKMSFRDGNAAITKSVRLTGDYQTVIQELDEMKKLYEKD